ncbi:MAG: D-2-hydroxyacid dehydrogenase [Trueperaceae bacterium]|nr:MAG: D-2-hydroxyacid dehydrogenase [Trueperaceae bacterium]
MPVLLLGLKPGVLPEATVERIRSKIPAMEVVVTRDREEIMELLGEIEIAAGDVPRDLLVVAPKLRWFQQWAAGADWLQRHPGALDRDFVITSTVGMHAHQISEQIFGYLLTFARQLHRAFEAQQQGEWRRPEREHLFELAGKTMLLIGVGAIGRQTARVAKVFGMRVLGIKRDPTVPVADLDQVEGPEALHTFLPVADVVVIAVPRTRETEGMIGGAELALMKPSSYLINIGRGGTVDEAALLSALESGRLAGAALDVFEVEPLPENSPFWRLENVLITAHYAGVIANYDGRAAEIFLDNLERYLAGKPLRNVVDKVLGY